MKQIQLVRRAITFLILFVLHISFSQAQPVFPKAAMINAKITPTGEWNWTNVSRRIK